MDYVYISGPLCAGGSDDVEQNVAAAIDAAQAVLDAGAYPYVPHLTVYWHNRHPGATETWMALDLAWLQRCDAVIRLPGESKGADLEERAAHELGLPVFRSVSEWYVARAEAGTRAEQSHTRRRARL